MITLPGISKNIFLEKFTPLVDISYLVRYIVVDRGIMNFDGIMSEYGGGYGRHNFFWYYDEASSLFKLIPWDLDKVFIYPEPNFWTNNKPTGDNITPNWNVVNSTYTEYICKFDPGSSGGSYRVLSIENDTFLRFLRTATWNNFCNQAAGFLDSVFTQERIDQHIENWRTLIANAVGEDSTIDSAE